MVDAAAENAAFVDLEQVKAAAKYLHRLEQQGEKGQENLRAFIRALADLARENSIVRIVFENGMDSVKKELTPEIMDTFRAYYLEGDKRPSPRSLSRSFYIDVRTIYRRNNKVIEALLVPFFGVDGVSLR